MKKLFIMAGAAALIVALTLSAYTQNTNEIEWLSSIDKKQVASYGDALILFMLQADKKSSDFAGNQSELGAAGISLEGYAEESELTKGMLSKMTAKYLDLGGSLMYLIFGTERYAYKACIANGIFSENGSENDKLSGPEMIEVFSKISEIKGEK